MKGFYIIPYSETYKGTITKWKVQANNDGIVFGHIVPPNTTPFSNNTLHRFTFPASANYAYWRFHMILMNNAEKAEICTLRWIPTLPDRFHPRRCPVGYMPRLMSNVNYCGFDAAASTLIPTSGQLGFKAFRGDGSEHQWAPLQTTPPYWIGIYCPTAVRIWNVRLRGRNKDTDRLYDWRVEGNDEADGNWDTLYAYSRLILAKFGYNINNYYKEFLIDSVVKDRLHRLLCNSCSFTTTQLF